MDHAPIMKENEISLLPIMRINLLGSNARALKLVDPLPNSSEIIDHSTIGEVQLSNSRRMNLES
jgi:hypothetical protein